MILLILACLLPAHAVDPHGRGHPHLPRAPGIPTALFLLTTGPAETEPTTVLYAFVFLVALGADYNIFLMHRVREEAVSHGTRTGSRSRPAG